MFCSCLLSLVLAVPPKFHPLCSSGLLCLLCWKTAAHSNERDARGASSLAGAAGTETYRRFSCKYLQCNFPCNQKILFFLVFISTWSFLCDRQPRRKSPWLCLWRWWMAAPSTCLLTQHLPQKRSASFSPTKSNSKTLLAFLSMWPCMKRFVVTSV